MRTATIGGGRQRAHARTSSSPRLIFFRFRPPFNASRPPNLDPSVAAAAAAGGALSPPEATSRNAPDIKQEAQTASKSTKQRCWRSGPPKRDIFGLIFRLSVPPPTHTPCPASTISCRVPHTCALFRSLRVRLRKRSYSAVLHIELVSRRLVCGRKKWRLTRSFYFASTPIGSGTHDTDTVHDDCGLFIGRVC